MFRLSLSIAALSALLMAHTATAAQSKPAGSSPAQAATPVIVNINSASVADLETLPGIGLKTAELIVEYRQKNGPFKKVEELMNIRGIGEKNFLKLKPQITVAPTKADRGSQQ